MNEMGVHDVHCDGEFCADQNCKVVKEVSRIVIWQQRKRRHPVLVHGDGDVVQNRGKNVCRGL